MKYLKLVVLWFFCLFLPLISEGKISKNNKEIIFETDGFGIVLDAKSGAWKKTLSDMQVVMSTNRTKVPFDLALSKDGKMLSQGGTKYKLSEVKELDKNTLELTIEANQFICKVIYQLFPDEKMIKTSCRLGNTTNLEATIYRFHLNLPRVKFNENSSYSLPGMFPQIKERKLKDFIDGRVVQAWRDPCAVIIEINPDLTIFSAIDRTEFYGDISRTAITEMPNGIGLSHTVESSGYLKNGDPWQIGDFYCMIQKNNGETALKNIHNWMAKLNMQVPLDRHKDCLKPIIYSFHPGQPGHPFQDWGGFVPSTKQLPRISKLNINTVWILPIESECPYIPDDFYRMANGIGTPEEYKQLVDTAHTLGMSVWQDVVPHGGRNRCQRAKDHPDWLLRNEAQIVPANRAFDYNNIDWQKYLGDVVKFYTQNYSLDGWRIDTSGFSAQPNWSKKIPYQRGSWAMGQGGLNMMKMIRNSALAINSNAMTLAECDGSLYGTQADIVYDFPLCRQVFRSMQTKSPADFVKSLQNYFYEQQFAELKDLVRLRYVESHDEPKAELLYGPEPMRAAIAVTAWVYGVPMIYKEVEDGHSEIISKILKIRSIVPELSTGKADYRIIKSSDGVFTCLRYDKENFAIPLVNFNPEKVTAQIEFPISVFGGKSDTALFDLWNNKIIKYSLDKQTAKFEIEIPAYSFTVVTNRKFEVDTNKNFEVGNAQLPYSAFILDNNGLTPIKLNSESDVSQKLDKNQSLVIRIDENSDELFYQVSSIFGTVGDKFRTRHPFYNSMCNNMYSLPSGHNVLWSSVTQPFGFATENSKISFYSAKGSVSFAFTDQNRPAGVFLLDRIGKDHAPFLVIAKEIPDSPLKIAGESVEFKISADKKYLIPEAVETTDKFLKRFPGGWIFDNGKLKLRIGSNGNLIEAWQKNGNAYNSILKDWKLDMRGGFIRENEYFTSSYELETYCLFDKQANGNLKLQFFGRPRGHHYYQILAPNKFNYLITYSLDKNSDNFELSCAVRANTLMPNKNMNLSFGGRVFAKEKCFTFGAGTVNYENDNLIYKFPDLTDKIGEFEEFKFAFNKNIFSKTHPELPKRNSLAFNGLFDGSFEFDYFGNFVDTVQSYCYATPWFMPFNARIITDKVYCGNLAVMLEMNGQDEMILKQSGVAENMKKGEKWRFSAQVATSDLRAYRMHLKLIMPNMQTISISIPDGTADYKKFEAEFIAPSDNSTFEIRMGGKGPKGKVYFDDVKLERVE